MSVSLMSKVFANQVLKDSLRWVMLVLADHANEDGVCYPSVERIRKAINCGNTRTVQRAIRQLQSAGYLAIEEGGGRHQANTYHLCAESIEKNTPILAEEELEKGGINDTSNRNSGISDIETPALATQKGGVDATPTIIEPPFEPSTLFPPREAPVISAEESPPQKPKPKAFTPPTQTDVEILMRSKFQKKLPQWPTEAARHLSESWAEDFMLHYQQRKWKVGKANVLMSDWKLAVAQWFKNNIEEGKHLRGSNANGRPNGNSKGGLIKPTADTGRQIHEAADNYFGPQG